MRPRLRREAIAVPARLGIGPVSKNTVDACLVAAYVRRQPLMLIASRTQVETSRYGGGYVEGWTSEDFANYVRQRDRDRLILICRDHGGPYQHHVEHEAHLTDSEVMKSAITSFREDIQSGYHLLHIDTSKDRNGEASFANAVTRLVNLYGACFEIAQSEGRRIMFEIGVEEQGPDAGDPVEFSHRLKHIISMLEALGLPNPTFAVAQTGTMVAETGNVGIFAAAPDKVTTTVEQLADITRREGIALKAHNADYLNPRAIRLLFASGVDAINIAPEFGVIETRALIVLMEQLGLLRERDAFVELAYESNAWQKWMTHDTFASDYDRAVIAGHYVFNTSQFREIKQRVCQAAAMLGIDVDPLLREAIMHSIDRYADAMLLHSAGNSENHREARRGA